MTEEQTHYEPEPVEDDSKSVGSFMWELTKIIIVAAMIIFPVRYMIAQPFSVKGASMSDTYADRDYLIIDQISNRFQDLERGDVVVFRFPRNPQEFYIKRIVGLPGETVKIDDGTVSICNDEHPDCEVLDESQYLSDHERTPGSREIEAGENAFVVLGDNRNASSDSRSWGELPREYVIGTVLLRAWPFNNFDLFNKPTYSI
ncbi:signal peptidase I [Patescibacteria group bacterium]